MITRHYFPRAEEEKAAMKGWILDLMEQDPTSNIAPSSGWSSDKSLFKTGPWPHLVDFIRLLKARDGDYLFTPKKDGGRVKDEDWIVDAWANVMGLGDRVSPHHHIKSHRGGENTWAGVYYVDAPVESAPIQFFPEGLYDRPRGREKEIAPVIGTINPRDGLLLLFPADMSHAVPGHGIEDLRISIAFNIRKATA